MNYFKRNIWMFGIIGAFIAFTGMMTGFAVYASHHKVDLVLKDYYKAEIEYQQQIDKMVRAESLSEKPVISYSSGSKQATVSFPASIQSQLDSGRVTFYYPADPKADFDLALDLKNGGVQLIPLDLLPKGIWKLKLEWHDGGEAYYMEKNLNL